MRARPSRIHPALAQAVWMHPSRIHLALAVWMLVAISTAEPVSTIRSGAGNGLTGLRTDDSLLLTAKTNDSFTQSAKTSDSADKTIDSLKQKTDDDLIEPTVIPLEESSRTVITENSAALMGVLNNYPLTEKVPQNLTKLTEANENLTFPEETKSTVAGLATTNNNLATSTKTTDDLVTSAKTNDDHLANTAKTNDDIATSSMMVAETTVKTSEAGWSVLEDSDYNSCPNNCQCGDYEERGYYCVLDNNTTLTVKGKIGKSAVIQCNEGTAFSCKDILKAPTILGKDSPLADSVSLQLMYCLLPTSLSHTQSPFTCLANKFGAETLSALYLNKLEGGFSRIPEMMKDLKDLEKLGIYGEKSENQTIALRELSLPANLTTLTIQSVNVILHPDDFSSNHLLNRLELLNAEIEMIPEGFFRTLNNLTTLSLWGNKFTELTEKQLEGLTSLKKLELSSGRLTSLGGITSAAPQLTQLRAMGNHIGELTPLRNLENLEKLDLYNNRVILTVSPRALATLRRLTTVNLSNNGIGTLPVDTFIGSSAIVEVNLKGNKLQHLISGTFKDLVSLEKLDLSGNYLEDLEVGLFSSLGALKDLNLNNNRLLLLPNAVFFGLSSLIALRLGHNRLTYITPGAFVGVSRIEELYLAHNNISQKEVGEQQYSLFDEAFNRLINIKSLDLSHNALAAPPAGIAHTMVSLETLNLSYNKITKLQDEDIEFLSISPSVDLSHNNISTVFIATRGEKGLQPDRADKATVILSDNPFDCDCRMFHFVRRLKGYRFEDATKEPNFNIDGAYCASPSSLRGRPLAQLSLVDLACTFNNTDCISGCDCVLRPETNALELTCSEIPGKYPDLTYFDTVAIELTLTKAPNIIDIDENIRKLNLSGLTMEEFKVSSLPKTLKSLDLSGNKLTKIPDELLKMDLSLRLSKNNFECDCWNAESVGLLKDNYWKIDDFDNVNCSSNWIGEVSVKQLCSTWYAATAGGILAVFGVLAVITAALVLKYNLEIKVWLYNKGWFTRWLAIDDEDRNYDAFLSFCHKDEEFVLQHLMPGLEAQPRPYKICVHYRDWIPGEFITTQIVRSVADSRRTIIVVSKNFLESMWGLAELKVAIGTALKEGSTRLIVILLEDIDTKEITGDLKAYISTNTYLKWGDPWFWDKLRYALPHRRPVAAKAKEYAKANLAKNKVAKALEKTCAIDTRLNPDGKIINAAMIKPEEKKAEQILDVARLKDVKIDCNGVRDMKKLSIGNDLDILKNLKLDDNDIAKLKTLEVNK